MEKQSYLGTGWAFPPRFIKGKGVEMVDSEEDIRQSLQILLSTVPGERMFRFDYGCNIRQWVFEELNLSTETLIIDCIEQAILHFEPRIEVEKVLLETKDKQEGILWINIDYRIRRTNNRSNMVYPFYFKEGTNL
ncbi:MAG: GPW/gp25 family protein [Dysgonamonadaceae bacterium]|jgi:phage baseplate assembly protein W|nr:GPW/gp25 family protein [Dysgonamonadaceae bacterium]